MRHYYSGCTFSGGEPEQHLKKCCVMLSFLEIRERKGKNWQRFRAIMRQKKAKRVVQS
jgi:hypothetical protein